MSFPYSCVCGDTLGPPWNGQWKAVLPQPVVSPRPIYDVPECTPIQRAWHCNCGRVTENEDA